ncbi:cell division protein FtsZ [Chromobacterium violaceum]|uniref:Cell division protein FtsZ n=2 Tax=Chromobacterium violaceum TaxID=536 RepID=A0A1R0MXK1_CHRVL|nr:cell division protein FtsZ [Chromobacterium violaceum]AAQ61997.1 cell division protein ftsZ [Chromobacterium violaceum ATCC 12472]ATP30503.1 cell division protein FtsZ [Chromobacterium violaceum]ATP34411.1 cell division protein FtsZ [Chromobacterium violaceum]KJH69207.1 cell division protein FtsZ [Chromobacterium violaceum]KMN51512.1 cell division protein FtsZ [Chromobacterium violaceum]
MSGMVFEVMQETANSAVIKVIGVGGGGCNAIDNMITGNVHGVEFICANTDAQSLQRNRAPQKLQLGTNLTRGLGAGANPEVGRSAALEDRERIAEMLRGSNMVFVTAGMGGGTGTGAAPVVAEVAKEMGILTVGVVTRPFEHEGKRMKVAQNGIEDLKKHVDSLIVIPNEKLMEVLGDDVTMREAFRAADDVLKGAVAGIAEVITCPGLINVDFADVRTVMGEMGLAMMGSAYASGIDRARVAAEQAVASPLLDNITLEGARGVLVNISTAPGCLKMSEYREIMGIIRQYADEDAQIKFGTAEVEDMPEDTIRVTLIATGLGQKKSVRNEDRPEYIKIVKTGTDDRAVEMVNYEDLDAPAIMRTGRRRANPSLDFSNPEVSESYDIPAFLRKQAD